LNKDGLVIILLGSLIATYLDLYFVGRGFYSFPLRPFPDIFTIHILFPLASIPVFLLLFLKLAGRMNVRGKIGLTLIFSLAASVFEKIAEDLGLFVHTDAWEHGYTFVGYFFYLLLLLFVHSLLSANNRTG
jgi:hypothetical protein